MTGTAAGRRALLHREAGRVLAGRPDADPAVVADHARLGGDRVLAATWLRIAAARAAERFDHATAEGLLDESLALVADHDTLVARAQVRIRRGRYRDAEDDVAAATEAGARRWEVGAWAAYFDRRFDDALRYADDGILGRRRRRGRAPAAWSRRAGSCTRAATSTRRATGCPRRWRRPPATTGSRRRHGSASSTRTAVAPTRRSSCCGRSPGPGSAPTTRRRSCTRCSSPATPWRSTAGADEALACFDRYRAEVERRDVPRGSPAAA